MWTALELWAEKWRQSSAGYDDDLDEKPVD